MFRKTQMSVLTLAVCVAVVTGGYSAPVFAGDSSPTTSDGLDGGGADALQKQLIQAKAELAEVRAKIANLNKEIEIVEKQINDLKTQFQVTADPSLLEDIQAATSYLGELEVELEDMQAAEEDLVRKIKSLQRRIAALGPSVK